ncbi:MAG: flagellar hook assembly protein FlgD [Myxococcota bacterium]
METGSIDGSPVGLLTGPEGGQLGKDEFLQLLIAQLTNQDPLEPMSDQEFVAQLAEFSALEQQVLTNDQLGVLQVGQSAMVNAQVTSLVGGQATVVSREFAVDASGGIPGLELQLGTNAQTVTVNIVDESGTTVRQIELGSVASGRRDLAWDGLDSNGQPVGEGTYTIDVFANDANGNEIDASMLVTAQVTGVTYESGAAQLLLGNVRVSPSSVLEVKR